jgi:hypothetical protein
MTRSTTPLSLGSDIEEVYDVFGEGFIFHHMGLESEMYERVERKAQRVRDAMLELDCPLGLLQRFEGAVSRINRSGDPLPGGFGPKDFRLMVATTERDLSVLMGEIRGHLGTGDAELYDLGVMLSRLSMSLRAVAWPFSDDPMLVQYHEIYLKELTRVVPIVTRMVQAVWDREGLGDDLEPELRRSLSALENHLAGWDGGSDGWSRTAFARTEEIFAAVGALLGKALPPRPDADQRPPVAGGEMLGQLRDLRGRIYQHYLARDFANAEQGQRLLIDDCRRTIGPSHELTLAVRNDLALTLLSQGRGDLAADRAYDVAEEAQRFLGARDPATAREQVRTLFVLMATKQFDECADFYQSKLLWLVQANPSELDPRLLEIRQELLGLVGGGKEK